MNLRFVKNYLWKTTGQLFRETEKLVSGQTETAGLSVVDFQDLRWCRQAYCTVELINIPLPKSTSSPILYSVWERWEMIFLNPGRAKFNGIRTTTISKILNRIDGQPMEFEWKIFPGLTTMKILNQIQQMMGELQCEPENFTGRIIFMSMFNDIVWDAKGNDETRENNSKIIELYARGFPRGHWSFPGPGSEKKWYGTYDHKPDGSWDRTAEKMLQNFAESGRQIFRCTSALERGESRSKGGRKTSIHFKGSEENMELLLRTVISVNQLSVYGSMTDLCNELSENLRAPGKLAAPDH